MKVRVREVQFVLKKHGLEKREKAVRLIEQGYGKASLASALAISVGIAEKWIHAYRAIGKEAFLDMGSKRRQYDYETKLAAARDYADRGMTRQEVMSRYGIANQTQLKQWAKAYREGGPGALRPKPKGRPRKPGDEPSGPATREEELEAENRRLRAEVAYLKTACPGGGKASAWEKCQVIRELSGQGHALKDLLAASGVPASTYHYNKAKPGKAPTRPELREKVAEIFSRTANGCGHRQIAMCLRAEEDAVIADKTVLKMMHEMGISCGIRRETDYHRYNSYRGLVGKTFENVLARDFSADGPWQKLGTDVTEFKQKWGKAYLAPAYDFGSKEIAARSISQHPNMAQQKEMLDMLIPKIPEGAHPIIQSDMGWQHQNEGYCSRLEGAAWFRACPARATASTTGRRSSCSGTSKTNSSGVGSSPTSKRSRKSLRLTSSTGTRGEGRLN